jgi:hypothetical protein
MAKWKLIAGSMVSGVVFTCVIGTAYRAGASATQTMPFPQAVTSMGAGAFLMFYPDQHRVLVTCPAFFGPAEA